MLLRLPVICWGAILTIIYSGICLHFLALLPETRDVTWARSSSAAVWAAGILWHFICKLWGRRGGIDIDLAHGQLPPD